MDPDNWEFVNEGFLQGNQDALARIGRRKPSALPGPSRRTIAEPERGQPSSPVSIPTGGLRVHHAASMPAMNGTSTRRGCHCCCDMLGFISLLNGWTWAPHLPQCRICVTQVSLGIVPSAALCFNRVQYLSTSKSTRTPRPQMERPMRRQVIFPQIRPRT